MGSLVSILTWVLALAATVLAFIFIVPNQKREKLNKFGKFLHDTVNFKYLIIEKILQAIYIFSTASVILTGFFMLFYVEKGYSFDYYGYRYGSSSKWYGGYGLLLMIVGPIVVRLAYELLMMFILLIKNVIQINNKMKSSEEGQSVEQQANPFVNDFSGVAPTVNAVAPVYCPACGKQAESGELFCSVCGTQLQ